MSAGSDLWGLLTEVGAAGASLESLTVRMLAWLESELAMAGCRVAAREHPTCAWVALPAAPALEAELGSRSLTPPGGVAPVTLQQQGYLAIALGVGAPSQAALLVPEGLDAQRLKPHLGALAVGVSLGLARLGAQRHEATVDHLTRKLRALQQVSHQINNSYDLKELSASICSVATGALGAQYAGLFHLEGDMLRVIEDLAVFRTKGVGLLKLLQEANSRPEAAPMRLDRAGFLREVVRTGGSHRLDDLSLQPEQCPEAICEHGLASLMATPLVTQREVLGVFLVGSLTPGAFGEREQDMLVELAQQATGAFVTSKLYAITVEEKQRADDMVERLQNLNAALASICSHLSVASACEALIQAVPAFVASTAIAIYLDRSEGWEWIAGDPIRPGALPEAWRALLARENYPACLRVPSESVWLFPLRRHQEPAGAVAIHLEGMLEATTREALETLVGHTALTLANAQMVEQVEQQAITDGLTGVFNRRYFNERLELELQRSQRYAHSVCLIIMDIDYFKKANDVLGHLGGDTVLKQLAALLKEKVRKIDIVARYGGEEFAIILPETPYEAGLYVAEKLRGWIEEYPFTDQEKLPHRVITASLGAASYPQNADGVETLIAKADAALYQAKQDGRNQVGRLPGLVGTS